jgi:NAD(P)-dependent dehydrogenase (short-subunit alcohol dehydrogenase family)
MTAGMATTNWTAAAIPSLHGRNVVVTGANSGIGYRAAIALAAKGAHVTLACRDPGRGEDAVASIMRDVPHAYVTLAVLDLASLSSVHRFADEVLAQGQPLHCLINNAGVMAPPRRLETEDGFELQFGTNVLGHFALTARLMPVLERAATHGARVVTVASIAHQRGRIDFDDLQSLKPYSPMGSYAQSKLADLMFALELDRRLRAAGSPVASLAVHPGIAATNLFRAGDYHGIERAARDAFGPLVGLALNSDTAGALPTLYAATSDAAEGGGYYGPQGLFEARGRRVGPARIAPQARDAAVAARLWAACEALTGVHFLRKGAGVNPDGAANA